MPRTPRITHRDVGRIFAIAGVPDHVYKLTASFTLDSEWCQVVPLTFDGGTFTVLKASLRRLYAR